MLKRSFFSLFSIKLYLISIFSHLYHKLHQYISYLTPIWHQKLKIVRKLKQSQEKVFLTKWQNSLFCQAWFLAHYIFRGLDFLKKSWGFIIIKCQTTTSQRFFSELNYLYYFLSNAVMKCYSRDESYCSLLVF